MKVSLIIIGFFWLFSLILNDSLLLDYKPVSIYTEVFFLYTALVIIISPFLLSIQEKKDMQQSVDNLAHSVRGKYECREQLSVIGFVIYIIPFLILLFSAYKSQMLTLSFSDYFMLRRGGELDGGGSITGINFIDVLLRVFVYPSLVSIFLLQIANIHFNKKVSFAIIGYSLFLILVYTYLLQVNYPIMLVVLAIFFLLINKISDSNSLVGRHKKKIILSLLSFVFLVFMSAVNRYGSFDVFGMVLYYPVSYFTLGISIFDSNFNNAGSIIHLHTYGLNLFGHLTLPFKYIFSTLGYGELYFNPVSIENVSYLSDKVDIGMEQLKMVNAFGTVLFSWYRDFGVIGIIIAPVCYVVSVHYFISGKTEFHIACYYLLLFNGIMGLTVSPLDQPHFSFTFIILFLLTKEIRWGRY